MRLDDVVKNELAKARDWGFGKSKNKGTNYFWMDFVFPNLVASDDTGEVEIRKEWYLTDNTIEYVLRDLAVLGWHGKDIVELDKTTVGSHSFSNKEVLITTKMEEYRNGKGEVKSTVKVEYINDLAYNPALESAELKAMSAKLKGKIAAYRSKNVGGNGQTLPAKKQPVPAEPVAEEDEIAF